ncbi:MAG: peptidase M16 protein, partial [uncultured bacterium]
AMAGELFENLMYDGSSMGRLIIGTKETVRGTNSEDLRQYMGEWYYGGNILVVIAGKVGQVFNILEEKLGEIKSAQEIAGYTTVATYGTPKAVHQKKKTEQAHFVMGVPGLSMTDPRRYALSIAQVVLGGSMSSRLFNEIREKRGLAYYVKADLDTAYDCGYLAVRSGVKLAKLGEAMEVVRSEMLKLGETFTVAELKRGQDYLLGKMPLSLEDSMGVAQFFGTRTLILDEIRQPTEVERAIKAVRIEEVREVLKELVKEELIRSVVVGPAAQ